MKQDKLNVKNIVIFAGAFASAMIGSGFASGQECLVYYSTWGWKSYLAIAIFAVISIWMVPSALGFGYAAQENPTLVPYKAGYRFYCGKILGLVMEIILPIFLLGVMVTMCSGAGSIFENYFGLSHFAGVAVVVAIIFVSYILGTKKLIQILGYLGPVIIVVLVAVCIYAIATGKDLQNAGALVENLEIGAAAPSWFMAGLLYATFGPGTNVAFLSAIGAGARSKKEAVIGGAVGVILMAIAITLLNTSILANISEVWNADMPTLMFAFKLIPVLGTIYAIIIFLGLYSTAAPMLWIICDTIPVKKGWEKWQTKAEALVICLLVLFGGQLPFSKLVSTLYPIMGYFGIVWGIGMLYRQITGAAKKKSEAK